MATKRDQKTPAARQDMPTGSMPSSKREGGTSSRSSSGREMPSGAMSGGAGDEMPSGGMHGSSSGGSAMPKSAAMAPSTMSAERVLVEMRVGAGQGARAAASALAALSVPGLTVDADYTPVPMPPMGRATRDSAPAESTVILRASIDPQRIAEVERQPGVVRVWKDTPIAPFQHLEETALPRFEMRGMVPKGDNEILTLTHGFAACPIGSCDCTPGTPKGTIADVAQYLGADQIWATGVRGDGIVVGVVDGGITALGRTPRPGETARICLLYTSPSPRD